MAEFPEFIPTFTFSFVWGQTLHSSWKPIISSLDPSLHSFIAPGLILPHLVFWWVKQSRNFPSNHAVHLGYYSFQLYVGKNVTLFGEKTL